MGIQTALKALKAHPMQILLQSDFWDPTLAMGSLSFVKVVIAFYYLLYAYITLTMDIGRKGP